MLSDTSPLPERDVVLRDGSSVHLRTASGEDEAGLIAFLQALSFESRNLRFGATVSDFQGLAHRWATIDRGAGCSLVALAGLEGTIIAHASYDRAGPESAEVAFVVADDYHGRGIATLLLEELAVRASADGISTFCAEVVPENARMLEVFRESGFPVTVHAEPGAILVEFPTELTGPARERFEHREQIAAAAAVRALLHPGSVAVIGASRRRGTVGGEVFHNLLQGNFAGPVYPVNPRADVVQSVAAYRSVTDIPGPIDLAVIALPAAASVDAARACAAKGVRSLVMLSPGFAETGEQGARLQRDLLALCRQAGMRLVGPNCMGVINPDPDVRLNATFLPDEPSLGNIGFLSQSGALGLAIIAHANRLGLGLSSFVSIGNKADLSGNDFLQYWEDDDATDVIALYLESVGNPRKFARIARRVARRTPVIVVKSGRSGAGARATSSHTGALIEASDVTVDALFQQAGVIRTDTLGEFFDVASLLANQPLPAGRRVAILTNGGGPGILAADACEANGLEVPPLPDSVRRKLATFLAPEAALNNPVDMIAASPEAFRDAIQALAACETIDALIVAFVPPIGTTGEEVAAATGQAMLDLPRRIPVLGVFLSVPGAPAALRTAIRMPAYDFPEEAARALARAARYAEWRTAPAGEVPHLEGLREDQAAAIVAAALGRMDAAGRPEPSPIAVAPPEAQSVDHSRWLRPDEVASLLECYGIPIPAWRMADSPQAAGRVAMELGGPVSLRVAAPGALAAGEEGTLALALHDAAEVEAAARRMAAAQESAGQAVTQYFVQRMVPPGVEMVVGVVHDRHFGPVLACGAGGGTAELLRDVAVRITPLTDRDAREMLRSLATFPLLDGYRGRPHADAPALEEILLRVSAMVETLPELVEIDCSPVVVLERGALVADARIRAELPGPR